MRLFKVDIDSDPIVRCRPVAFASNVFGKKYISGNEGHRGAIAEADVDGFNLAYAITPGTFAYFIDLAVPELRRRGLVWEDYEGETLRESIYEPGQVRLRDDHPGARYRRG